MQTEEEDVPALIKVPLDFLQSSFPIKEIPSGVWKPKLALI